MMLATIIAGIKTTFAQVSFSTKDDVKELKRGLINRDGFLSECVHSEHVKNYSITSQGRIIKGDFDRYSFRMQIDLTITNFAQYDFYSSKNDFLIVTAVKDGIVKVFVDLDAYGTLDEFISNGSNFPGNLFQKEYAMYISFSVHG